MPRWGLKEAWIGLGIATVAVVVGGTVILAATGQIENGQAVDDVPLWVQALTQIPLWAGYLGVPVYVARTMGAGLRADFGLWMKWLDVPVGLAVGALAQLVVIPVLYLPLVWLTDVDLDELSSEARELTDKATDPVGVVLLVLIVVVAAPFIEELFFRGLFQRAAVRRLGPVVGVGLPALVFGAVHFQPLQLPALVLFGVVAGVLARRTGRLGPSIWAHVGFNAVAVISLLSR